MRRLLFLISVVGVFLEPLGVLGDTPANCTYEEIRGQWTFFVGEGGHDRKIDCANFDQVKKSEYNITLEFPNVVTDQFGNKGFWTLIYNQGFEVFIHGRKFFAFSKYEGTMKNSTSFCDQTLTGWTHDVFGRDWACYYGRKDKPTVPKIKVKSENALKFSSSRFYVRDDEMIKEINSRQSLWRAKHYPQYEQMTLNQLVRRAGGDPSSTFEYPEPAAASEEVKKLSAALPTAFDWRDVNGISYVAPVRSQGSCGSCYAFASVAMNEARIRIATNNSIQPILSPQDVVDCSQYSQGCMGGFPYLVGGKYSEDYGMVDESCVPYTGGETGACTTNGSCHRYYFTGYHYIGGYYGACNEESMMVALVNFGPIAVSLKVYPDLRSYDGGIYNHTGVTSRFNPFQETDHVVTIVGYGIDAESGTKYWIVKNSWGDGWGEDGYFRIRKGTNEVAIESIAVQSFFVF